MHGGGGGGTTGRSSQQQNAVFFGANDGSDDDAAARTVAWLFPQAQQDDDWARTIAKEEDSPVPMGERLEDIPAITRNVLFQLLSLIHI